jgi:hypothetical protein
MRLTNYNISDSYILGGEYALLASRKAYSRCKKGMSLNVERRLLYPRRASIRIERSENC